MLPIGYLVNWPISAQEQTIRHLHNYIAGGVSKVGTPETRRSEVSLDVRRSASGSLVRVGTACATLGSGRFLHEK